MCDLDRDRGQDLATGDRLLLVALIGRDMLLVHTMPTASPSMVTRTLTRRVGWWRT